MSQRRLVGIDLGIASAHTVRVLREDGSEVCRRRCWPRLDSLLEVEAAALVGAPPDLRLEVVIEPTGPAWLPIAVFFARPGPRPGGLLAMARAALTRLISKASNGHLGGERAQAWLDAAHLAVELYGDHPAHASDDRAAEVMTEVRLLHATEAELPAHESAREQAYLQVDPDQLARSLPGVAAVGRPAPAVLVRDARRFPDGASFRSFTGLPPRAPRTAEAYPKGQPMSKAGPRPL